MEHPYFVIDVFTHERFAGNPAAVVFDADDLSDRQKQSIAAEFNVGVTAFVLTPSSEPSANATFPESGVQEAGPRFSTRLRWFTPTIEIAMCGHASIASLRAFVETGRIHHDDPLRSTVVEIENKTGLLLGFVERIPDAERDLMIWLDLIDPVLTEVRHPETEWASVLGISADSFDGSLPAVRTQDRDLLLFVRDFMVVNDARPDFKKLAELQRRDDLRGVLLSTTRTLTPSIAAQSRFFAPSIGIDEDTVSGSVHGPLGAYLLQHDRVPLHEGLAGMSCTQGKPGGRTGLVHVLVQPRNDGRSSVRIGGRTAIVMRGILFT